MPLRPGSKRLLLPAMIVAGWLGTLPAQVCSQERAKEVAAPTTAELEKRIRDLEETVRRLQAEKEKPAAAGPPQAPHEKPAAVLPAPLASTNEKNAAMPPLTPASALPSQPQTFTGPASVQPEPGPGAPSNVAPEAAPPEPLATRDEGGLKSILAGWDEKNGFFLRSADDRFHLRITGQIQADYRTFLDDVDYTDIDTFLVRRARLGIEADMFQYYEFRLLPDFSNAQAPSLPGTERIQDAYLNVHYWNAFQVEAGKFKQPFSYEQLIQDRFVPTAERSLIDQLVPARDEGIMIHGYNLFCGRFDYQVAVSNGEINGDFDTNDLKDLVARVAVRPFNNPDWWMLKGLQLGMGVTTGHEQEPIMPNQLRTPATVLWFTFNSSVRANGLRNRWSPEVVYFNGPFGIAAQYFRQDQKMSPVFAGPGSQYDINVPFEGYYIMATYLLTGEERTTYSAPVVPNHPFDPLHPLGCSGAWELVGRVSRLTVGDEVFMPLATGRRTFLTLADPTRSSLGATEMTLGFNWYLNAWVRVQFNWEHAWFEDPVRLGPGLSGLLKHQDSLISRFQVIF
jgi:phosphate-selective porin OprO/OprP